VTVVFSSDTRWKKGWNKQHGMKKEIIINAAANETRIAITEDGRLAELFVETANKEKMVGDIYLGKVAKVMPGIRAAFIDLGLGQDGFLHFSDIGSRFEEYNTLIEDDEEDEEESGDHSAEHGDGENGTAVAEPRQHGRQDRQRQQPAQEAPPKFPPKDVKLEKGQEIIIQIIKEPVGKKGVRVTSEVSLAGRFLVLLPFDNKVGISKKITNFKE